MIAIEMCAGAGGQALGLHEAGFEHAALIEVDHHACETLRLNNRNLGLGWGEIIEGDLKDFAKAPPLYANHIDLVAGGVPCPPFSKAGQQLGDEDERDLFPTALQIVRKINPKSVMLENVPGLFDEKFRRYREKISDELADMGYESEWKLHHASDYGVPQIRPRVILVAMHQEYFRHFIWPEPTGKIATVGDTLYDLISAGGWQGAAAWRDRANKIAPTLVGGSKKHGGPTLDPLVQNGNGGNWELMDIGWLMMMKFRE